MKDYSLLEKKLELKFNNQDLLLQAFCHRSYLNENPTFHLNHNERLEFLGDAVLEVIVTEYLYKNYQNPEGELTNWRAALVNTQNLAKIAKTLGFEDYLLLSKGEEKDKGKARQYILANTLEAFLGALYLDRGLKYVSQFVKSNLLFDLPRILKEEIWKDAKSQFQEVAQEKLKITPTYKILKEWGPDHVKHFVTGVFLGDKLVTEGEGSSKQEAEEKAAQKALKVKNW